MDKFVIKHSSKPTLPLESTKQIVAERDGALIEFYPFFMEPAECNLLFKELKNLVGWHIGETITRGGLKKTPRLIMGLRNPNMSELDTMKEYGSVIEKGDRIVYEVSKAEPLSALVSKAEPLSALVSKAEPLSALVSKAEPLSALVFPPLLMKAHDKIKDLTGETFNFAYLNYYRNGDDHISWHNDKEGVLESESTIASLSLGETRDFNIRHIGDTRIAQNMSDDQLRKEALEKAKTTVSLRAGSLLLMKHRTQKVYHHQVPKRANCRGVRINITFRHIRE
jgi:alkylated DNA repair dioxygenase AlkB